MTNPPSHVPHVATKTNWAGNSPPPRKGRPAYLVVIDSIAHQVMSGGGQPVATESRYSQVLRTNEQAWVRFTAVGERWTPLDAGWLDGCSLVLIENLEKEGTPADIIVGTQHPGGDPGDTHPALIVPPGTSARFKPLDLKALRLRCTGGEAKYRVHIFPE